MIYSDNVEAMVELFVWKSNLTVRFQSVNGIAYLIFL